jgi:hypothetical protein
MQVFVKEMRVLVVSWYMKSGYNVLGSQGLSVRVDAHTHRRIYRHHNASRSVEERQLDYDYRDELSY